MKNTISTSRLVSLARLGALAALAATAGCASASGPDSLQSSAGSTQGAQTAEASASAADLAGTWDFALAASDVAAPLREECARSSGGDAAKADACFGEIATQASKEKIRFAKAANGTVVWTSFETDGKTENVYVEVLLAIAADGPGHVLAKAAGAPKGPMAERFAKASPTAMRIELVDPRTIAMNDPKKGRLVYTKR